MEGGVIADLALAWGGVAHKPWRATRAEEALLGGPLDEAAVDRAVEEELRDAVTGADNAYKRSLLCGATKAALSRLADLDITP